MVKPWEKTMLDEITRGITYANLGLNPQSDGEQVIINVPPLTEERRLQLVKQAKTEAENGKIGLRSARKEAMDMVKTLQKDGLSEDLERDAESDIQDTINDYTKKIDDAIAKKEQEILTI
jgi:ribosome recycling factor